MSLALFIYNPAPEDASVELDELQSGKAESGDKAGHSFDASYSERPRSLAFPSTVAVAILVLVLSVLKSTLVEADTDSGQVIPQNLTHCQQSPTVDSRITCPLDLMPGATLSSARIAIESTTTVDSPSRCTLFARAATGGQARGVTVKASPEKIDVSSDSTWLDFPQLSTQPDDFRYVVCDLASGARVTGLEVTLNQQTSPSAIELKRMIRKQLTLAAQSGAQFAPRAK